MKAYSITMPSGHRFTVITDELVADIPASIFERFRVFPVSVVAL